MADTNGAGFMIRQMTLRDVPAVKALERLRRDRDAWPGNDWDYGIGGLACLVGEVDGERVGAVAFDFDFFNGFVELLNIVVAPGFRRQGFGSALLWRLQEELARKAGWHGITAQICEDNLDGTRFLRARGFAATGLVRNAYEAVEPSRDAIVFRYLRPATVPRPRVPASL